MQLSRDERGALRAMSNHKRLSYADGRTPHSFPAETKLTFVRAPGVPTNVRMFTHAEWQHAHLFALARRERRPKLAALHAPRAGPLGATIEAAISQFL